MSPIKMLQGCLSEHQNVDTSKRRPIWTWHRFHLTPKETILQQRTARWHFFPFLCGYFSYTQPLVVSTLMAKSNCTLSWTICDLKIILQFSPLVCKWDDKHPDTWGVPTGEPWLVSTFTLPNLKSYTHHKAW